jgi:biopolymer transport protein ExbD
MRFARASRGIVHLDLTPMIDVTFMLLIFFLVTTQMAAQSRVDVHLPVQRGQAGDAGHAGLTVKVKSDGSISTDGGPVDAAGLVEVARLHAGGGPAVVRADRDAPAAALNAVARALQAGGMPSFQLATEQGKGP